LSPQNFHKKTLLWLHLGVGKQYFTLKNVSDNQDERHDSSNLFSTFLHFDKVLGHYSLWQYGLSSFQEGDTTLERFLPKNQHTRIKGNCGILRIGGMGRCQKVSKFDFQSQFSMSKIIQIFLNFFLLKNTNLGAHFFIDIF
jgi:hypothetical protein